MYFENDVVLIEYDGTTEVSVKTVSVVVVQVYERPPWKCNGKFLFDAEGWARKGPVCGMYIIRLVDRHWQCNFL